jgi:hypothetical protein
VTSWIIRCAGDGTRWGDFLGVPKHLIPLNDEPILHRTVRLIREFDPSGDVTVVVRRQDIDDERYAPDGVTVWPDEPVAWAGDLNKFVSSRHLWSDDADTVTLFGDVWFSREVLSGVAAARPETWWAWLKFGQQRSGRLWGGEVFAFRWTAATCDEVWNTCQRIASTEGADSPGGWMLFRALSGGHPARHVDYPGRTLVDDWTNDFDAPWDWHEWCYRWATSRNSRPL